MNAPPLIAVPAGAVTMVGVWQLAQPTDANSDSPRRESGVAAMAVSRGGTLVDRMKSANSSMSSLVVSSVTSGSPGNGSVPAGSARPLLSCSSGSSGVEMPISFE